MREKFDEMTFSVELEKRLDEIIAWIIKECPLTDANLDYGDFAKVREDFRKVASGELKSDNQLSNAEPEDGGPQYINDNPAPWP